MIDTNAGSKLPLRQTLTGKIFAQIGHDEKMHRMHRLVNIKDASGAFEVTMHVVHHAAMNLRTYRRAKKLSQRELADMVESSQKTILRAEKMDGGVPIKIYADCAAALGITLSDIFADERTQEEALLVIAYRAADSARKKKLIELLSEAESLPPSRD